MFLKLLINGLIIGILVSIPLGPIGILVVQRTVNKSRAAGFLSGIGAAMSDTLYAVIAGFSLTFIINFIRQNQLAFQILGAIVLVGLGVHIFFKNPVKDLRRRRMKGNTHFQDILTSFLLTFSNPLAVFVFIAIFAGSGVVVNINRLHESVFVILGIFMGASMWWFSLSGIVSLFKHKINLRFLWWLNKVAGLLIIVFVIVTIIIAIETKAHI